MTETLGDVLPPEGHERAVVSLEHNQSIGEAMKVCSIYDWPHCSTVIAAVHSRR